MICLDKQTGNLNWKIPRESSSAWASPVVIPSNSGEQILLSASRSVMAYDAETGKGLWEVGGIIGNNVPSITVDGEWIVIGSSRKGHCHALRMKDGHPELAWKSKHASSSFGSPLITDGRVYFVNKTGIVFCHELESGDLLFNHRLPSSTWASPRLREGLPRLAAQGLYNTICNYDDFRTTDFSTYRISIFSRGSAADRLHFTPMY